VLVRAQFLESLGDLDEASADTQAVAYAARRTDYYRWFLSVAAYRNRRLRGSHPVAVEAAFDLRVRRSIELARNFRDAGFDPAYPIVLRAGQTILPTSTGKVLGRQLFLSDGCHRLALLVLAGVTELGPSHYVVERHRQIVPTDNTAILLRRLVLDDASYYGFLARGYATEPAEDRVALVAATPAALQAELAQILAIDEALIAQNSRGADDLVAPKGGAGCLPGGPPAVGDEHARARA